VWLQSVVDLAPRAPRSHSDPAPVRVHGDAFHRSEVDDEAIVRDRETHHVVAGAFHGERQVLLGREGYGAHDIRLVRTAGDECGPPIGSIIALKTERAASYPSSAGVSS
jgi:hypothetical protein